MTTLNSIMTTTEGAARRVFLIGPYAFKFRKKRKKLNRRQMAAELSTYYLSIADPENSDFGGYLVPILFHIGTWLIVQPRCKLLSNEEIFEDPEIAENYRYIYTMFYDVDEGNVGLLNGKLKIFDYGLGYRYHNIEEAESS